VTFTASTYEDLSCQELVELVTDYLEGALPPELRARFDQHIATDPFPCPAAACSFIANFMTAVHLILVWEERDDPNLLRHAQRAKEVGRNPRVTGYRSEFGPGASYYAWEAAGRPVHGIRDE